MTSTDEVTPLGIDLHCDFLSRSEFWSDICHWYEDGKFCDLRIKCQDGELQCHRLLLASSSKLFYNILRGSSKSHRNRRKRPSPAPQSGSDDVPGEPDGEVIVQLPDYPFSEIKEFVDKMYSFLACKIDEEMLIRGNEDIIKFFQFGNFVKECQEDLEINQEQESEVEDNKDIVKMQIDPELLPKDLSDMPDLDFNHLEPFPDQFSEEEKLPKKKKRRRQTSTEDLVEDEEEKPKKRKSAGRKKKVKEEPVTSDEEEEEDYEVITRKRNGNVIKIQGTPFYPKCKTEDGKLAPMPENVTPESLYQSMKTCSESITCRILTEPLDVISHCNKKQRELSVFQALMGVIKNPEAPLQPLVARPLAWSYPTGADITPQFDETCKTFRSLFGFSDSDMHYNGLLFSRQGLYRKNKSKKIRYDLKRRYAKLFKDQLDGLLNRVDIQNATRRYARRPQMTIENDAVYQLELRPDLVPESYDGILLVSWSQRCNAVVGRVLSCPGDDPDKESDDAIWALFDVWCIGQEKLRIPDSEYLRKKFNALMEPMETFRIVQEFEKEDPDGKQRETMLKKEKQCSECGKVFPCVTVQDEFKLTAHKKNHYYENFVCDCPEAASLQSLAAKRNHVKLVHSDGRYVKCDHCSYVSTEASVRTHCEREHNKTCLHSCVCETCGKVLNDSKALYMHMLIHKQYKCKLCGVEVVGYSAFNTHKKNFHPSAPQSFPCEVCGKEFPERVKLKNHFLRIHVEDKDRPYQCTDCGRGFAVSRALSAHRMMAHIKTRPYQCRYGCGAAYNDHSSRGTHERKKHGGRFPVEKMKPKI